VLDFVDFFALFVEAWVFDAKEFGFSFPFDVEVFAGPHSKEEGTCC